MAERVASDLLAYPHLPDGFFEFHLHIAFVEMVASVFAGIGHQREPFRGEEPLPDDFYGGVFVLFFQLAKQERPAYSAARSFWWRLATRRRWASKSSWMVWGSGTVGSFFPLPSWMVSIPASKWKSHTRSWRHSNSRRPHPYRTWTTRLYG